MRLPAPSNVVLSDGFETGSTLGSPWDRVLGYIQTGREEGARVVTGGGSPDRSGYFVQPTLFAGASPAMTIARE